MSKNNNMLAWLLAVLWLGLMVFWVFPRAYYGLSDNMLTLVGTRAVLHGWQNQDMRLILRPGYLLNVPLMAIGFSQMALKVTCFFVELVAFMLFLLSYSPAILKSRVLPLCLMLFGSFYAMPFQMFFNYYSAMTVFLLLGFAAYWRVFDRTRYHRVYGLLAGVCFAFAVMSNLAVIIAVTLVMFGLACYRRKASECLMLMAYLLSLLLLSYAYFHATHAWSLYRQYALERHSLHELVFMVYGALILLVTFLSFCVYFYLVETTRIPWLRRNGSLVISILLFVSVAFPLQLFIPVLNNYAKYAYFTFAASTGCVLGGVLILRRHTSKAEWLRALVVFVPMVLIAANYRAVSHGHCILYLFLAPLFAIIVFECEQRWQASYRYWILLLATLAFLIVPISRLYFFYDSSIWIGVNTTQAPSGVMMDPQSVFFEKQFLQAYQVNQCEQKTFYAFYMVARAYWITHRQPLFNDAYVTSGNFQLKNRYETPPALIQYFESHPHWCVLAATFRGRSARLQRFVQWLDVHAGKQVVLPGTPYQGKENRLYVR